MDLKSYFHQKYQGGESFIENVILPIFGENKYEDAYEEDVIENNPDLETMAKSTGISNILRLGTIQIPMNPTDVFDITVDNHVQMERNRVTIQALIRRIMSTYSSAFMIFHYNDTDKWDWRFSFCSKLGNNKETTDSKRYTFLLGPNQSCRTAAENFNKLAAKAGKIELEDIVSAFDVETLSKEFFDKYKKHYETFCDFVYENKDNREYFGEEFSQWEDKTIRDYVKKLLGRIVFLHFLQKKGWLGVPADKEWGDGETDFMRKLFDNASLQQKDNYLDEVLEPLFEYGLDTDRTDKNDLFDTGVEGFRNVKVPYLNGGLFDRDVLDEPKSRFPKELFDDLLRFFSEYNFTIDENDPNDAQVGVDPEMLGRIFENLLEDNKDKGAFYTPKEIVQYMCRESLIAYLQTDVKDEESKEAIRKFVTTYDVNAIGGKDSYTAKEINEHLKQVKICDPAIGSGAFPMGLLKELFFCRGAIETFDDAAEIKRHIIQQNIYGVDIEKGAVDIARLRFWLALIVDEKTPHALPNLDFKIMQGNSLLEQYEGVDLSGLSVNEQEKKKSRAKKQDAWQPTFAFDEQDSLNNIQHAMGEYYRTDNYARKNELREIIDKNVKSYIVNLKGCTPEIKEKIKKLQIPNNQFFLWHIYFKEVFDKGGFDIVIGNPPYVLLQTFNDERIEQLYKNLFSVASYKIDLYHLFIEHGYNILKDNGVLSYINPSNYLTNNYIQPLRDLLLVNTAVLAIINIGDNVFEASVNTCIELFRKTRIKGNLDYLTASYIGGDLKIELLSSIPQEMYLGFEKHMIQPITSYQEFSLCKKIERSSDLLKNHATVNFGMQLRNRKIYTNDVLVSPTNDMLTSYHRKCLTGKDIYDYVSKWNERYCYFNEEARCGGCWTESVHKAKDKIVVRQVGATPVCGIDSEGLAVLNSAFMIVCKDIDPYGVLGLLNSKLIKFYWCQKFEDKRKTFPKIKGTYLELIPIIKPNSNISSLVHDIIKIKALNPQADTSSLEHEIDLLVYDLYGLTKEERLIVDPDYKE